MSESKFYTVRLVKGFSHTERGTTFFQNRPRRMPLTDTEVARLRAMEGGTKFQVIEVIPPSPPVKPEPPSNDDPVVDENGDEDGAEGDDEDDEDEGVDLDAMTKAEIKAHLDEYGDDYDDRMTKAELIELAEAL